MSKQHDKKYTEEAAKYYFAHKEFRLKGCVDNLGISKTAFGV